MTGNERETEPQWGISGELRPYVDLSESEAIDRIGRWLRSERPDPPPWFRAELRAELADRAAARGGRPPRLGALVVACIALGLVVMAVAAVGLAGVGPLG